MTTAPRISAIICTHNRADYLDIALRSLSEQLLPADEFETLVVDNASTDQTAAVVRGWESRMPNLRYHKEERLGLSWARNAGAREARSPYLAFLDDDARAEPDWLKQLLRNFTAADPAPACIGGRVWLDWGARAPSWLPTRFFSLYTFVDHGGEDRLLREREYLVGANIAFRRDALLELGGFDTNLGRKGSMLLSGEESEVVGKILERGLAVYYAGSAVVWHAVPPSRRKRRWFLSRMFWDGASQPFIDFGTNRARGHYLRQGYLDLRRIARFTLDGCTALARGDRAQGLDSALAIVQRAGRLRTHLLLAVAKGS